MLACNKLDQISSSNMWRFFVLCLLGTGTVVAKSSTYRVNNTDHKPCIMATMSVSFDVPYMKLGGQEADAELALPETGVSSVGSTCIKNVVRLVLSWGNGNSLKFDFHMGDKNSSWDVQGITLTYNTNDSSVFINSSDTGLKSVGNNDTHFKTKMEMAYLCNKETTIKFDHSKSSKMTLKNLKVQAYKFSGSSFSSSVNECSDDSGGGPTPPKDITVPIAVGATLAILIVILIIAYFVGRRSTREYQSI